MPLNEDTEALIIGAGPVGLFQAFELGLLGIQCQIIEALDRSGGQCEALYPDKPIYDIPGIAVTTASQFIQQLRLQIKPFNVPIHYRQQVLELNGNTQGFVAATADGSTLKAKQVILATGAGAFTPVRLRLDDIHKYEDKQIHYRDIEPSLIADKNIAVIGDNQSAVDCAIEANRTARSVALVHRKRRLEASKESLSQLDNAVTAGTIRQLKGKIISFTADDQLRKVSVRENSESTVDLDIDHILVRLGNSPKQSDLEAWGITTSARHVPVDAAHYQTQTEGIYAVGDINTYPAKRKLILCGFHEATLAAYDIAATLRPDKPLHLQYTTTSTELQQRLGVV